MKSDVANLVAETFTQNAYGVMEANTSLRQVYVDVTSVGSSEWFEGSRNGLNPQLRFTMFSHDYNDEKVIEYNGVKYTIYRTYLKDLDHIELYTELKKGNE